MSGAFTPKPKRHLEGFASGLIAARTVSDAALARDVDHEVEALTSWFALEASE